jgi:hypothetical protein
MNANPGSALAPSLRLGALALLGLLGALSLVPATASAQDPHAQGAEPGWYGWQTLAGDASAFGLMGLGGGLERPAVSLVGVGAYVLTTPIVHLVHGNDWAIGSLLLRVAGPGLVLAGLAVRFGDCPLFGSGDCNEGSVAAGTALAVVGLGLVLAMPIVDTLLAREVRARSEVSLTPWLSPSGNAGGLSLMGRL